MRRFVYMWLAVASLAGAYCLAVAVAPAVAGACIVTIVKPAIVAAVGGWTWPIADSVLRLEFDAEVDPQPDTSEDGTHSFATLDGSANEPTWLAAKGPQSACMWFDGVNDFCYTSNNLHFADSNVTFSAWLCSSNITSDSTVLARWDSGAQRAFWFRIEAGKPSLYMSQDGANGFACSVASAIMAVGTWIHITMGKDGTNGFCYSNGVPVDIVWVQGGSFPTNVHENAAAVSAGGRMSAGGLDFVYKGFIDELAIWPTNASAVTIVDVVANQKAAHP